MSDFNTVYNALCADPVNNADMLALLRERQPKVVHASQKGVVLWFDDLLFVHPENQDGAMDLLPFAKPGPEVGFAVLHGHALVEPFCSAYGYRTMMTCYNHLYRRREPPAYSLPQGAAIRPLTAADLPAVQAHYRAVSDPAYLKERLEAGMFGVTIEGVLAGFIGTHTERSMGMLEVFSPYRRMGLAYALEAYLIARLMEQGRMAFCQVVTDNLPSLRLQQKLGLAAGNQPVTWLEPL